MTQAHVELIALIIATVALLAVVLTDVKWGWVAKLWEIDRQADLLEAILASHLVYFRSDHMYIGVFLSDDTVHRFEVVVIEGGEKLYRSHKVNHVNDLDHLNLDEFQVIPVEAVNDEL